MPSSRLSQRSLKWRQVYLIYPITSTNVQLQIEELLKEVQVRTVREDLLESVLGDLNKALSSFKKRDVRVFVLCTCNFSYSLLR